MIRRAHIEDIDRILSIVRSAQLSLRELGIDQWQDGYPSREAIEEDIRASVGYVECDDCDRVIGYAAIVLTGESAYLQIADSDWHTADRYVVVHRLCVAADMRRCGVAVELMRYAAELARRSGIFAFRIDTHEGNIRMRQMMQRLGFAYCGIIYYDSGKREAYDLDLTLSNTI